MSRRQHMTEGIPIQARHLHAVPERRIERAEYVPAGRALHLVDVENLMGGPEAGVEQLAEALDHYKATAPFTEGDHAVMATNPALAIDAKVAWRGARVFARAGQDGADAALLEEVADIEFIAQRYDTIVVGSGDGIFNVLVGEYRPLGLTVGVVSRRERLSFRLGRAASFVRFLPEAEEETVAI